jgi:hypothetical protein
MFAIILFFSFFLQMSQISGGGMVVTASHKKPRTYPFFTWYYCENLGLFGY